MMQPGPPWPREGSAVREEAGGRASHRAHPAQSGVPGRKALHLCPGLATPAGAGSGPAPSFESLLRPPALCLGPKLALRAAPKRADCESQVRAAASALRPRHRQAGRPGSPGWERARAEARGGDPRGRPRCIHSATSQKVSKPEPAGDLMGQGSRVPRPEVGGQGRTPQSECPKGVPLRTHAVGDHG